MWLPAIWFETVKTCSIYNVIAQHFFYAAINVVNGSSRCDIHDNTVSDADVGIIVTGSSFNRIIGNHVQNTYEDGIAVWSYTTETAGNTYGNIVTGNSIAYADLGHSFAAALVLFGFNNSASDNSLINSTIGLKIFAGSVNTTIGPNTIANCTTRIGDSGTGTEYTVPDPGS